MLISLEYRALVMTDTDKFLLRLPAELKAQLEKIARAENRSLNQQIVTLLQQAVKKEKR